MAHVGDRARAVRRLERAVEHRQMRLEQMRRAFDRVVLVDVLDDLVDLFLIVAEAFEGDRDGLVDDLQHPAADEFLVLDERDVRLDAGRVAIHHEGDRAGRREHGNLRVAIAKLLAERVCLVPNLRRRIGEIRRQRARVDAISRSTMLVDDSQERLFIETVAGERTKLVGDSCGLRVRLAGENRRHRCRVIATFVAVIRKTASHQHRAEVGVADAQGAEGVGVALDGFGRIRRIIDNDFLRCDDDAQRGSISLDVESVRIRVEAHQIQRSEIARRVVEEHVFGARIRCVDARCVGARIPVVHGRVELHAGIAADPRRLRHLAHQLARFERVHDAAAIGDRPRFPDSALLVRSHEIVGDAHGVVRVLELHRVVRAAVCVECALVAGIDQRPRFALLALLRLDEVEDVGMVGVENHHLRRAASLAAALDHAGERVVAAHERHRSRRRAAAGEKLSGGADVRQIRSRSRAVLEEHAFGFRQRENGVHRVGDGIDEARGALRPRLDADVEPHRRIE